MASSSCHGFGGAKQRRLERLVRRQRYDSPGNTTSTRALCPPKPHGPGAPALNPPRMLAEATRSTARCDTLHNPPEGDRDSPPRRAKTRTRPKPSVTQPGTTRRENPGCPMGACANQRDTAQPKPTTVSSLTPDLSRAAKRRRLEGIVSARTGQVDRRPKRGSVLRLIQKRPVRHVTGRAEAPEVHAPGQPESE